MIFKREKAGFLAGVLNPGKRAVAISVTPTSGASGFILPGDFVDVILSFKLPSSNAFSEEEKEALKSIVLEKTAETIVRNARVLAIGQKFKKIEAEAEVVKTVTLEVTPKQSETLALAASMGKISLVLRSLSEGETTGQKESFTSDLQISKTLRGIFNETERAAKEAKSRANSNPKAPIKRRAKVRKKKETIKVYRGNSATTQELSR